MSARYVFLVALVLLLPFSASAHGDGSSFEQDVGQYFIDIGYEPAAPRAGERLLLDLALYDSQKFPADFTNAWVRMSQGSTTLLATAIHKAAVGPTTLLTLLPSSSEDLSIYVRFERAGREEPLAEWTFATPVTPGEKESLSPFLLFTGALCAGLLALCSYLLIRTRRG